MEPIIFDERGFGTAERFITWQEVQAVGIRTTDTGPFSEDLFWQFLTRHGLIELPGTLIDGQDLTAMQHQLPGFDSRKVVAAMGSVRVRVFRVWHPGANRAEQVRATLHARFAALITRLGGTGAATRPVSERLLAAWGEPHRRYHELEHLLECLVTVDELPVAIELRDEVELALWFHDAVYRPEERDNEEKSALLFLSEIAPLALPEAVVARAAQRIRATAHASSSLDEGDCGTKLVLDIDLAILAADPVRFLEYEHAIEEEFAHVRAWRFELARGRFLASLLARPALFRTTFFRERLEAQARSNLTALLASPRYRRFRANRWIRRALPGG